ncbi:hypothetical protein [Amycolatopsis vancoresmycina]|uniref:CHAT domain-containing protein n=1 Tax=Amycolatopsis vancoresmycina DSM 44592 TaxID=1292037 RepID=R1HPF3_9PSEU|nr:hypothetical protein [Amycolatopsis vancoresmycina]EOD65390.1 hypothetical protein H480_26842 [Amycolatopsis vancoresmycina DSM 44592]
MRIRWLQALVAVVTTLAFVLAAVLVEAGRAQLVWLLVLAALPAVVGLLSADVLLRRDFPRARYNRIEFDWKYIFPDPPRVFDLTLRRGAGIEAAEKTPFVGDRCALQAGGQYLLDARIGGRSPWSVVRGPQPGIDPLLPDSASGHELEVVIYTGGFTVDGPPVRPLRLPPAGPSETVVFELRAPAEPGEAWVRVNVLHRDNLIQTYRLVARVGEREQWFDEEVTAARLEYSATTAWANVADFRPRYVSLVVNADAGDGRHRVFVKSTGTVFHFPVNDDVRTRVLPALRDTMTDAARGTLGPDAALRALAEGGWAVWAALFGELPGAAGEPLRELTLRSDEIIQITRAERHHSVPWTLLYDWLLPAGPPEGPVCWGFDPPGSGKRCGHHRESRVICARGFWGVRHQVEERLDGSGDLARHLVPHRGKLKVDLALGVVDAEVTGLVSDLAAIGAPRKLGKEHRLLSLLWDPGDRAPVVTILGHHDADTQEIDCGTAEIRLTPRMITEQRVVSGSWTAPSPLILLLACGSGVLLPGNLTNHVSALTAVGASGVVATECVIMTDHARQFARCLVATLAGSGASVGAAMQAARQHLLAEKQVPALAFVAFGSADVVLEAS